MEKQTMENAVSELKENLTEVARVFEWAALMGYQNPKRFSDKFLNCYGIRPQKIMELVRLKSIITTLRKLPAQPNLKVARLHSLPNEKTLNNFTNYHTGYSPTNLKNMGEDEVNLLMKKLWSKVMEEYGVAELWSAQDLNLS